MGNGSIDARVSWHNFDDLLYLPWCGEAPVEWRSHGQKVPDSKCMWMAFLGPDVPGLGERKDVPAVTQSQIAATAAALLGEDYTAEVPKAGKPIAAVLGR